MPSYNLLETAVYDEYARWCERGKPQGIPLLDCRHGFYDVGFFVLMFGVDVEAARFATKTT